MIQNHNNDFLGREENSYFSLAAISSLGHREEQQDSIGYDIRPDEGIVVICDGMGGHSGGKLASSLAVDLLLRKYAQSYPSPSIPDSLRDAIEQANLKISKLCDDDGRPLKAGSTAVVCQIRGNRLYWISVGDSRMYIMREDELVQATDDHIYQKLVDEELASGTITEEEHKEKSSSGEVLISFLGVGNLTRIDISEAPFELRSGDKIIMMSDGLYKLINDEEIKRILCNFNNIEDGIKALELKAQKAARATGVNRDNMTVAVIKVK